MNFQLEIWNCSLLLRVESFSNGNGAYRNNKTWIPDIRRWRIPE